MDHQILRNALLSQAIGDAVGAPFEFMAPTVRDVHQALRENTPLSITDDTQMALFGLQAMVEAQGSGLDLLDRVQRRYCDWYDTQNMDRPCSPHWLAQEPLLRQRRAPGNTCLNSLKALSLHGVRWPNCSKGNGAVMRSLPFLFWPVPKKKLLPLMRRISQITHDHPESIQAVLLYGEIGRALLSGQKLFPLLQQPREMFPYGLLPYMERRIKSEFGNTFTAMPALLWALWALWLGGASLEDTLAVAIVGEGDNDTLAAIAGSLWGLTHQPPDVLVHRLVELPIIERVLGGWTLR